MLKTGIFLLFGTFTQLIAVIIAYEFFFKYAAAHGGIGFTDSISAIKPVIWVLIIIELILSVILIRLGLKHEMKNLNKKNN